MFYLDGISLSFVKEELKKELLNKKINRIFKNNEYSISLHFGKTELLFSCNPNFSICYINQNKEKPILDIASSVISNLRKNLMNAMLIDIKQLGFDRILVFHFAKINELGEIKKFYIYFECLGKVSNFIFCDEEQKIIDSLKKSYISDNTDRILFCGEVYKRPSFDIEKKSPFEIKEEDFENFKEKNIVLLSKIEGIGKLFVDNSSDYKNYRNLLKNSSAKIFFKNKNIVLATILNFDFKNYDEIKVFRTFSELVNFYVSYETVSINFSILKKKLLSAINKKIKRLNKTLKLIEKDILVASDMDGVKEKADILASVLYSVKRGMKSIVAYDFYNNKNIEIELSELLSPKKNLDTIYKQYNKMKRALKNAQRRNREILEEIEYLESTLLFIENSTDIEGLREIEEELVKLKYLTLPHKTKKTNLKKEIKYGIFEFEDSLIFYGRNNLENDNLTFKIASKTDYWFHAKDIPSSHIIVKTSKLTDSLLKKACEITAYFTKLAVGEKISIEYTQRKYINKPSGVKPGFVTYTNQKTYLVKKVDMDLKVSKN